MGRIHISLALIFVISLPQFHVSEASGFSIDLIHRDAIQSQSQSSDSYSELVKSALQRSFNRAKNLVQYDSTQSASTDIVPDKGEFLMRISLGTPNVETLAIADTGSDLTWIQCTPCTNCFKQNSPLFKSNQSSTYKPVSCSSNVCTTLPRTECNRFKSTCRYNMMYGDNSYSQGELATETITFGSTTGENVSIPDIIIGCGHMNRGTFGAGSSGIVGLGGGNVSLIRQMETSINGKFSYCLVPGLGKTTSKSSKMNFGDNAVVSGAGAVSTPIVDKSPATYYYLTLEGMSVGDQRIDTAGSEDDDYSQEGNIIIDSGTTLTFLPPELYTEVQSEVRKQMSSLKEVDDPAGLLDLCYISEGDVEKVPEITVHFKSADLKLKTFNAFVKTTEKSLCLAFAASSSLAIYGNLAQMDFLVGYDLEGKTVSFKPTDCTTGGENK